MFNCCLRHVVLLCVVQIRRRGLGVFTLISEPKSTGYIRLDSSGEVEVEMNYLKDEQDVFDAIRSVQSLLEVMKNKEWRNILEPVTLKGCPFQVLNGILDLVANVGQILYGELFQAPSLHAIRRDIGYLRPGNRTISYDGSDEFSTDDGVLNDETFPQYERILEHLQRKQDRVEAMLRTTEPYGYDGDFPSRQFRQRGIFDDRQRHSSQRDWLSTIAAVSENAMAQEDPGSCRDVCEDLDISPEKNTLKMCPARDPYEYFYGACRTMIDDPGNNDVYGEEDVQGEDEAVEEEPFNLMAGGHDPLAYGRFWSNVLHRGSHFTQWAASYPPVLPRSDRPEEVARFIFAFMTSLWHLHGTSAMGKVIDTDFNVLGVDNLSIADASTLVKLTRMNPTATLIMMGRYIGLQKLEAWRKTTSDQ